MVIGVVRPPAWESFDALAEDRQQLRSPRHWISRQPYERAIGRVRIRFRTYEVGGIHELRILSVQLDQIASLRNESVRSPPPL